MNPTVAYMESPIGLLRLAGLSGTLLRIDFVETRAHDEADANMLQPGILQLGEYFEGKRTQFDFPFHAAGTHFQQNVWDELKQIPYAKTMSYESLARKLGDIKVIRAAASANGRNPLPVVIPCHRVIGKDGSLTGYSGGIQRKKWLLDFEQRERNPKLL